MVELSGRCFSGSKSEDMNVGSCRPRVRETRVEMPCEEAFKGRFVREPVETAPRLMAVKHIRM